MRATAIGLASVMALGVGLASPALGGGGMMHSSSGGGSGGMMHSSSSGGISSGVIVRSSGPSLSGASFSGVKSGGAGPGPAAGMRQMSMTRMGDRDHFDRDHDRHDRDHDRRFRFFPSFAFNTYYDSYYPDYGDCWDIRRVHTPLGWRWHRVWVCNYSYSY